jgi:hypothetical protein
MIRYQDGSIMKAANSKSQKEARRKEKGDRSGYLPTYTIDKLPYHEYQVLCLRVFDLCF